MRMPTLDSFGLTSFKSSRRFPQISIPASTLTPVKLPPGRAKLFTRPNPMGSTTIPTRGIVAVAALRFWAMAVVIAKTTSGFKRTTSRASSPYRSTRPSPVYQSTIRFCSTTYPSRRSSLNNGPLSPVSLMSAGCNGATNATRFGLPCSLASARHTVVSNKPTRISRRFIHRLVRFSATNPESLRAEHRPGQRSPGPALHRRFDNLWRRREAIDGEQAEDRRRHSCHNHHHQFVVAHPRPAWFPTTLFVSSHDDLFGAEIEA